MLQFSVNSSTRIFAFFGTDIQDYPKNFIDSLYTQGYVFFALDSKAIEYCLIMQYQYSIVNDWLTDKELLEIKNIAWECETNWYLKNKDYFTINEICWPEIDHMAMHWFWLDAILAGKLADLFKEDYIVELLLIKQELEVPVQLELDGSICKEIWINKLPNKVKCLKSKNYIHPLEFIDNPNIYSYNNQFLFSPRSFIAEKILYFIASDVELARSNELLRDFKNVFPNEVVFFPCNKPFVRDEIICTILNKWKIPIVAPVEDNEKISSQFSERLLNAYKNSIETSKLDIWGNYLSTLGFHFSYYCQIRWPKLIYHFTQYLHIFSKNRPKLIISSILNITEWHLPIIAAQRLDIPTISMPHSVSNYPSIRMLDTDIVKRFDYHFFRDNLYKNIMIQNCSITSKKLLPAKNCTDINSYNVKKTKSFSGNNLLKILILFSPTSTYRFPITNSRLIFPSKNPNKQIEAISFFTAIIKDFHGQISMRFKVHPSYSELELFAGIGEESFQYILPTDSELEPILDEADIVVGVNYYGSALIHSMHKNKPYINYITDNLFYSSFTDENVFFKLFTKNMINIFSEAEFRRVLKEFLYHPDIIMLNNAERKQILDYYFNNSNFPSSSEAVIKVLNYNLNHN